MITILVFIVTSIEQFKLIRITLLSYILVHYLLNKFLLKAFSEVLIEDPLVKAKIQNLSMMTLIMTLAFKLKLQYEAYRDYSKLAYEKLSKLMVDRDVGIDKSR